MTEIFLVPASAADGPAAPEPQGATTSVPPAAQPLVALDPAGTPTPLSYNVPEPMAFSGRNFITIDLPREAFSTPAVDPEQVLALTTTTPNAVNSAAIIRASLPGAPTPATAASPDTPAGGPDSGAADQPIVPLATTAMTAELAALTVGDAQLLTVQGQRPLLVTNSAGLLDYQLVPSQAAGAALAVRHAAPAAGGSGIEALQGVIREPPDPPDPPMISVFIDTPAAGSTSQGSAQGVTIPVGGHWIGASFRGSPTITLSADGQPGSAVPVDQGRWSAAVTFTSAGQHTLTVAAGVVGATYKGHVLTGRDTASVSFNVLLGPTSTPPPVLPTVIVSDPRPNWVYAAPNGQASVTVTGQAATTPAEQLTVTVTDTTAGGSQTATVPADQHQFSVTLPLLGLGVHQLRVVASTAAGVASAEVTVPVTLSIRPPTWRITNRLMIVETLNLASYPAAYGAGRVLNTFSLLPGEKTTISLKTYRNETETSKQAASILDSAATEASHDFDDTLSAEQTDKDSAAQSQDYKVGATATASWGFGNASINASYSGSANSAREDAVKKVSTAVRKHALKASTNRSITVNTETASALTTTQDDATIREITNINVSRTLNFVFRQMNQEHIVLYHLTNARVAYYTEDIPLDADGKPQRNDKGEVIINKNYQEVSLPELNSLLNQILDPERYTQKVHDAVVNALSGIPDYNDRLQTLIETVTPTDSAGDPVVEAAYLRVARNLQTAFQDPASGFTVQVPGIVLAFDHIVQRTDGVFVEAILGQGDALDAYSHGLQDAAVAEKQAVVARAQLAAGLVTNHDDPGASIYQKVFPTPSAPAASDGQHRG